MPPPAAKMERTGATTAHHVVLLVEDEPMIRLVMAEELRAAGYTVLEAGSGNEARRTIASGQWFDLLLTDFAVPPGPTGLELAAEARSSRPGVAVVLVSANRNFDAATLAAVDRCFDKPIDYAELIEQLAAMMASRNWGGV